MTITNERGDESTPSVLYRTKTGGWLVGKDAIDQATRDPKHAIYYPKTKLGTSEPLLER